MMSGERSAMHLSSQGTERSLARRMCFIIARAGWPSISGPSTLRSTRSFRGRRLARFARICCDPDRRVWRSVKMKKLINRPEDVVKESMAGLGAAHGNLLRISFDPDIIIRADAPVKGKVAVVSGGGSGHEPMHGGFVGKGMLDAACPGAVFTSPTPDQMAAATKAVDGGAGILHIVKNYSGDVMNFEMAMELCQAEGLEVEAVVVNDDVAVEDSLYTSGRRGVGTTVLAEKVCGAAAERGDDLKKVADLCRKVNSAGRSMGMALTSCTVPAAGKPTFEINDNEMEIGIGIHGEPGRQRMPLRTAREIVEMMVDAVVSDLPFKRGDRLIAMVNGMGGSPLMELYLVYNELHKICNGKGLIIARRLVGNFITSLEMAGCSITLMKADDELLQLWDAPVNTPALRWGM
jgi:dihydroxyacetone kinase-like protein